MYVSQNHTILFKHNVFLMPPRVNYNGKSGKHLGIISMESGITLELIWEVCFKCSGNTCYGFVE